MGRIASCIRCIRYICYTTRWVGLRVVCSARPLHTTLWPPHTARAPAPSACAQVGQPIFFLRTLGMAHSFLHWTLIYSKIPRLMVFTIVGTSIFLFAIVSVGYTGNDVGSCRDEPRSRRPPAPALPAPHHNGCPRANPSPPPLLASGYPRRPPRPAVRLDPDAAGLPAHPHTPASHPQRLSDTRSGDGSVPDAIIWIMVGNLIGAVHYFVRNKALWQHLVLRAQQQRALRTIQKETEKCEQLLANILPPHLIGCLHRSVPCGQRSAAEPTTPAARPRVPFPLTSAATPPHPASTHPRELRAVSSNIWRGLQIRQLASCSRRGRSRCSPRRPTRLPRPLSPSGTTIAPSSSPRLGVSRSW